MIIVSSVKADLLKTTKPIRCPKCKVGRLCDMPSVTHKSIRIAKEGTKTDLIVKCPRCAEMVSIEIVK